MRKSIATVCISGSLDEKLTAIARAGFDGLELFENDLVTSAMTPELVAQRCADLGLAIYLYQPFRDFEAVDPAQFDRNMERAKRKFELMNRLGVDLALFCSNVGTATIDGDHLAIDQLGELASLAARSGVRVAYEALAWGKFVSTYDHAWNIVDQVGHDSLGVCLDSFHILSRGSSLESIGRIPGEKIFFCQLADAPAMTLGVLEWSRHHRLFPGEGSWDLTGFVNALLDAGYAGPLSLEVFNDSFRQGDPTITARDALRSLIVLEDSVRASRSARTGTELAALPPLQEPTGFSFVELQPGEGSQATTLLGQLGFQRIGKHRRKEAELWAQGDARIVVNYSLLGRVPKLVAVGVDVADVHAASERARSLKSNVVPRDVTADEEILRAVAAPDGTEFYFSGDPAHTGHWSTEFSPAPGLVPAGSASGITGIDHVALVQPWQRIDEAVLFFRSVLGLIANDSATDLPGQHGLIRSRSLTNRNRAVRLALNVTPIQADLDEGYPNHIALLTQDLVATVDALRTRGLRLLPVPENYYEDLQSRSPLAESRIACLRHRDIFYDSDEHGEFLHAYTRAVGSVYFELVQRMNGYDGYGAANAPVRLAIQQTERIVSA